MELEEKVKQVEKIAKEKADSPSIVHGLDHLRRTAEGSQWLVKAQGGTENEQLLAYAAGWLHDIVRPLTNEVDHAEASAKKAKEILKEINFSEENIEKIVRAVRDHREKQDWVSPLHGSIYIVDKLLEGMGAFIIFRRCTWVGESPDFEGMKPLKANISHFEHRMKKHSRKNFPEEFSELVDYQFGWQEKFLGELKEKRDHALRIMSYCYNTERQDFEQIILNYDPKSEEGRKIKEEAVKYIDGKLYEKFESFL